MEASQAKLAEKIEITREKIIEMLLETRKDATADKQHAAAARSIELVARLLGHIVERRDMRVTKDVSDLSEEELEAPLTCPPSSQSLHRCCGLT